MNTPFRIKVCQITVMILSLVQKIIYAIKNSNLFCTEGLCWLLPWLPKGNVTVPIRRYHFGFYLAYVPFVPPAIQTLNLSDPVKVSLFLISAWQRKVRNCRDT